MYHFPGYTIYFLADFLDDLLAGSSASAFLLGVFVALAGFLFEVTGVALRSLLLLPLVLSFNEAGDFLFSMGVLVRAVVFVLTTLDLEGVLVGVLALVGLSTAVEFELGLDNGAGT